MQSRRALQKSLYYFPSVLGFTLNIKSLLGKLSSQVTLRQKSRICNLARAHTGNILLRRLRRLLSQTHWSNVDPTRCSSSKTVSKKSLLLLFPNKSELTIQSLN